MAVRSFDRAAGPRDQPEDPDQTGGDRLTKWNEVCGEIYYIHI